MIEYQIKLKRRNPPLWRDLWLWKMAWRDARHNGRRLLLFAAALITGIAAVVALDLLNHSIQGDIDRNARELLGADFVISGNEPIDKAWLGLADTAHRAEQQDMASMVTVVKSQESRLIRLVALTSGFPLYGVVKSQPKEAWSQLFTKPHGALLDEALARQYDVVPGDSVRVGAVTFYVLGVITEFPGGGGVMASFTPSVYISRSDLAATELIQFGSRVNYKVLFRSSRSDTLQKPLKELRDEARLKGFQVETVESRKESLGRAFGAVYQFFSLLAFLAVILGCIGVASSVYLYAREKRAEVAILRCLGSSGNQAFTVYYLQVFAVGLLSSLVGTALGVGIQIALPWVLQDLLPFDAALAINSSSLLLGMGMGVIISILFSALPLLEIRDVSPLTILRSGTSLGKSLSPVRLVLLVLAAAFPFGFATWLTGSWITGFFFFLTIGLALLFLSLVARALLWLARNYFPSKAGFVWRHAIASLFRPQNQTSLLLITLGLGVFILATLNITRNSLLAQVEFAGQENQSNTILFDIQPNEVTGVTQVIRDQHLEVKQAVPLITCRIATLKNKPISAYQKKDRSKQKIPNWALTREYRVTYRDSLTGSEKIVSGSPQRYDSVSGAVQISISVDLAENLQLAIGDSLGFDVQGLIIPTTIGNIREVDWPKDPPNFTVVFPKGVLEQAPAIFVVTTHVPKEQNGTFQRAIISRFPTVSIIDLGLILATLNDLFNKLSVVIQFLALFSVITGLVILTGAVLNSRYIRQKEFVLLRTLGAKSWHINAITWIEYGWIGTLASLTGIVLAVGSGWFLTTYFFEIAFQVNLYELGLLTLSMIGLTMGLGWFNSRKIIRTPPLKILREE